MVASHNRLDNSFLLKRSPEGDLQAIVSSTGMISWTSVQLFLQRSGTREEEVSSVTIENGFLYVDKPNDARFVKKVVGRFQMSGTVSGVFMPRLERVFGPMDISSTGRKELPRLNSVGGPLHIGAPVDLPSLLLVNDSLSCVDRSAAALILPSLVGVGGDLSVPGLRVQAPQLRFLGGTTFLHRVSVSGPSRADLSAPLLQCQAMGRSRAIDATLEFCKLRNQQAEQQRQASADLETDISAIDRGPLL